MLDAAGSEQIWPVLADSIFGVPTCLTLELLHWLWQSSVSMLNRVFEYRDFFREEDGRETGKIECLYGDEP